MRNSRNNINETRLSSCASASRLYLIVLIGCSETRTGSARVVLNTCFPMRPYTVRELKFSSVQFGSCAANKPSLAAEKRRHRHSV